MKQVKEMWCLVDSVGPTFKDYLEELQPDTKVFIVVLKDNPTLMLTVAKLIEQGCKVTLVFEQKSKKLWKKYLFKYVEYETAVILDNDVMIPRLSIGKFDKIIVDADSIYCSCLNDISDKTIMYINHIPFRPFKGVKLDRQRLLEVQAFNNTIEMSQYVAYVFDREGETLLNQESTIKVDLSNDKVESFEADDRCVKTYNILDYLEEKKFRERKTNIHKQLPKTATRKSTTRKNSKS